MEISQLKQKLYEEKNKMGLVGGSLDIKEYDESENDVSACISPQGWNIEISLKKGFNPIQNKRQRAYARKKQIDDGLESLISGCLFHEIGHWELPLDSEKGCPYDIYEHDKILEAVKQALPNDKQAHTKYVANAFEDVIDNARGKEYQENLNGLVLFWDNEGERFKKQGQKVYSPFYEAFVKLNMHLSGDNVDKALLKRHYSNNSKIDNAVKKVISDLKLSENLQDTTSLFYRKNWAGMAGDFAKDLAELLEDSSQEKLSAFSSDGQGEGQKIEEQESGNGIEQKLRTKNGKEEIAYGRYASDEKLSSNFTDYEQLDALYKKLARAIPVKVEVISRDQSLNISPLTLRAFDEEKDDLTKVKLSKLFLTDKGLQFGYQKEPLTIHARSKVQRKGFPDFKMIVLDNSGSMQWAIDDSGVGKTSVIPWGDNSKYHYALLGFYGIENFLQMQGIAQYIQHGLSMFSSNIRFKQANYQGIDEVRKLALKPEFGSTNLNAEVLEESLSGRESFVLSLSDGEVGNWNSEKEKIKKLVENNYFAHVQLGSSTRFSKDLESWKVPVFYVSNGKDLSKLMVDVTKQTYNQFIKMN